MGQNQIKCLRTMFSYILFPIRGGGGVSKINAITLTKFNAYTAVDQLLQ